jgi:hypothetical protein
MADRKISDLTALTTPASGDFLPIVDISEAAAASKNKRITIEELMRGVPDGTAAAPGIAFETYPSTGVYSSGANQLAVATNGTGRLFVDASGRVGINTASPSTSLHVQGANVSGKGQLIVSSASAGQEARMTFIDGSDDIAEISTDGNNLYFYNETATGAFQWYTNGSERALIDSSGRLLVGTSSWSSGARAVVAGNSTVPTGNGVLVLSRGSSSAQVAGDPISNIEFTNSSAATFARISVEADGTTGTTTDLPGRLLFWTTADGASSPTERMRITNIGIVNTFSTTSGFLGVRNAGSASGDSALIVFKSATSTTNGTACMVVRQDGDLENTNNSYGALSDVKLKENIVDANSQWDDLKALQVRNYNFKKETDYGTHRQIGLIAQEVELVSPGLVSESPDRDEEGNDLGTATKSVNYSVLYMKAVKALQEAMERIEQLETSNADLLARVTALETS